MFILSSDLPFHFELRDDDSASYQVSSVGIMAFLKNQSAHLIPISDYCLMLNKQKCLFKNKE